MEPLIFIIGGFVGSIIGTIVTRIMLDKQSAYGVFSLEPGNDPDDPDVTNLRIKVFNNQDLYGKNKIILLKDSHK